MKLNLDKMDIEELIKRYKIDQGFIVDEVELNYETTYDEYGNNHKKVKAILKRKIIILDKKYEAEEEIQEDEIRNILILYLQRNGEYVKEIEFQIQPSTVRDPMEITAAFELKNKVRGREMINNEQNNNTK